jgi:C-terminal processing protease CtpA/Prc
MQAHSINRATVDWVALCTTAWSLADGAQTSTDTYYAIQFALTALGDRHSLFMRPNEVTVLQSGALDATNQQPAGEVLAKKIGYIHLSVFNGSEQAATEYATKVQAILRQLDSGNMCGWVVDLADNRGGNVWPMVAGIGPLLDGEIVGAFVDPDGQKQTWFYRDGQAGINTDVKRHVRPPAYRLKGTAPVVAVVTSGETASSGEAIAVTFRGRPHTRSFGTPTAGLSTGLVGHKLSDGAALLLAELTYVDRTGQHYGKEVIPDTQVVGSDQARQAALDWLLGQPPCKEVTQ